MFNLAAIPESLICLHLSFCLYSGRLHFRGRQAMRFNLNTEFLKYKQELLAILVYEEYYDQLLNWVSLRRQTGLSKKQIFDILRQLFEDIQNSEVQDEKLTERIADFLDGFTPWAKDRSNGGSTRILPNEPDI
jgi:hypothetical protein